MTKVMRILTALAAATAFGAQAAEPFAAFDAASEPILGNPHDVKLGPDGMLYVSDVDRNRVAVLDPSSLKLVREVGADTLYSPHDVDFDAAGRLLVADTGRSRIAIIDTATGEMVGALTDAISRPEGVVQHPNGRIYATGAGSGNIVAYENGALVAEAGGLSAPHDVEVDAAGDIWIADAANDRLVKVSPELETLAIIDDPALGLSGPRYLDVDAAGNLIVADKYSHRVLKLTPVGELIGVLGGAAGLGPNKFRTPEGVEIDGATYFLSDSGNDRVTRYRVLTN